MEEFKFRFGDNVVDKITGTRGEITARAEYVSGSRQYMIEWFSASTSDHHERWFHEDRLEEDVPLRTKLDSAEASERRAS